MPRRVIMRIEIGAVARQKYADFIDAYGLIGVATTTRLIEWFLKQDEEIQTSILGLHPMSDGSDISVKLLRRIRSDAKWAD